MARLTLLRMNFLRNVSKLPNNSGKMPSCVVLTQLLLDKFAILSINTLYLTSDWKSITLYQ